ncbi:MAG: exonuclease domain-containing protein, partial [Halanaerobium sp.]
MTKAVTIAHKDNLYKYLICDQKEKIIYCITDQSNLTDLEKKLKAKLNLEKSDYQLQIISDLSLKEELLLIWPQIIKNFESYFSFSNNWLKRAQLFLEDQELKIKVETRMAQKKLAQPKVISFLENNIGRYLTKIKKISVHNGDFLPEIEEETDPNKFKQRSERTAPPSQNYSKGSSNSKKRKVRKNKERYGRVIRGKKTHDLIEIDTEIPSVIVEADLFDIDVRQTRKGSYLYILKITDYDSSISAKCFCDEKDDFLDSLSKGQHLKIRGKAAFDPYSKEWGIIFNDLNLLEKEMRQDKAETKRVELHLHTQMSAMDSVINVKDVVKRAGDWGHQALAITDHGVVQSFPDAYAAGEKHGVKIIYGVEAYLVDDGEPIVNNPFSSDLDQTEFIVFDLETTGLNPSQHEIIEIGAVKFKGGEIVGQFKSFINPDVKIPAKITEITGINDRMVKDAPGLEEVIRDFIEFAGEGVLVAHNADFDYGFIRTALENLEIDKDDYTVLDTLGLARALVKDSKNHKLNTLTEYFGVELENHHRALDDAAATAEV